MVTKPKDKLNQFDRAVLTEANEKFSIPINFKKRFAGFTKRRPTLANTGAPILPAVQSRLLANYTDPVVVPPVPPRDVGDNPKQADTYAHWRPAGSRARWCRSATSCPMRRASSR